MFKIFEKSDGIIKAKLTEEEKKTVLNSIKFGTQIATSIGMLAGASMALFVVWVLFKLGMI